MIVLWSALFVMGGVWSAYALKRRFSGCDLNHIKLYSCVVYNGYFVVSYIEVIKYGEFPFFGIRTDFIIQYPIIAWLAFFGILAHGFALPMKWKVRRWF